MLAEPDGLHSPALCRSCTVARPFALSFRMRRPSRSSRPLPRPRRTHARHCLWYRCLAHRSSRPRRCPRTRRAEHHRSVKCRRRCLRLPVRRSARCIGCHPTGTERFSASAAADPPATLRSRAQPTGSSAATRSSRTISAIPARAPPTGRSL